MAADGVIVDVALGAQLFQGQGSAYVETNKTFRCKPDADCGKNRICSHNQLL